VVRGEEVENRNTSSGECLYGERKEASATLLAQGPFNQDPVVCSSTVALANAIPLEEGNLGAGPSARGTLSRARQNASIAICQEHSAMTHGSEGSWPLVHPADWGTELWRPNWPQSYTMLLSISQQMRSRCSTAAGVAR
jgi:hypothetical protein